MKNFLCLLLFISLVTSVTHAQFTPSNISQDTFRIQKVPLRYFFADERIRTPKQIQPILMTLNDPQINRDWQTAKTTRGIGTGVMVLGLAMEGLGLLNQIKGNEGGAGLLLGGAGVMLGGLIINISANRPTKRAITRYNDLQTGRISLYAPQEQNAPHDPWADALPEEALPASGKKTTHEKPCPCFGFRTGLNISKLWEIGGSDPFKTDEKTWWAQSMPFSLSYEMPGIASGHGTLFDLTLLNKGFRVKSEMTNSTGSTHSRSDLQIEFLQLSALKKLPIGSQTQKLRLYGTGGAFAGYALKANQKTHSVLKNDALKRWTSSISKHEFGEGVGQLNARRFDAGLVLGAGVSYPLGPGRIMLDARTGVGVINLEKSKPADRDLKYPSLHTRDLTLLLGYSVPIATK